LEDLLGDRVGSGELDAELAEQGGEGGVVGAGRQLPADGAVPLVDQLVGFAEAGREGGREQHVCPRRRRLAESLYLAWAYPQQRAGPAWVGHEVDQIAAQGDGQDPTAAVVPVADVTPSVVITPGSEVIDGVPFVYEAHSGGEATDELVIKLPEHGVLVAQDLVYHQVHLFLGNNDIAGWQRALEKLAADTSYDTILAGHGLPAGPTVYTELLQYLTTAYELLGEDGEAYKKTIIDRYPTYGSPFVIDIANGYLFGAHA
jgi:hypothetical protein